MILIHIENDERQIRLDKFLCFKFDISFALAQKLIRESKIKINGNKTVANYKIKARDQLEIFANLKPRKQEKGNSKIKISTKKVTDFLSWIIFEDDNILAINKPSGLAVQGGSGIKTAITDFFPYLNKLLPLRNKKSFCKVADLTKFTTNINPQISLQLVHRLDKDTSGILLIAKNKHSAELLTANFKEKTIKKTYLALVNGHPAKKNGAINIPLRKKFVGKNEKVYRDETEGKEAVTEFKLLKNFSDFSLLELSPITGRTHQLRVHCKEIGNAILGDIKYGGKLVVKKDVANRLCLHAAKIEIQDYYGKKLEIQTPLPDFLQRRISFDSKVE